MPRNLEPGLCVGAWVCLPHCWLWGQARSADGWSHAAGRARSTLEGGSACGLLPSCAQWPVYTPGQTCPSSVPPLWPLPDTRSLLPGTSWRPQPCRARLAPACAMQAYLTGWLLGTDARHTRTHRVYFQPHMCPPVPGLAVGGGHTLGLGKSCQPSSWPILTRAAMVPRYTQLVAPIP